MKPGSLLRSDFKAGQVPPGPQGAQGIQGIQGLQGPGAAQISYTTQVNVTDVKLATVGPWEIWAQCDHQGGTNFWLQIYGPGVAEYEITTQNVDNGTGAAAPVLSSGTEGLGYMNASHVVGYTTSFQRFTGTLVLRSGTTAAHVAVHGSADGRTNPGTCSAYGVAIPAT